MESKWPAYTDDPEIIKRGLEEYRNRFGTDPKGDTDQEKYIVSRQVIEVAEWNGPDDPDGPVRRSETAPKETA